MVAEGLPADAILTSMLDRSGYLNELHDSKDPQDETRLENLRELITVAREFVSGVALLTVPEDEEVDEFGVLLDPRQAQDSRRPAQINASMRCWTPRRDSSESLSPRGRPSRTPRWARSWNGSRWSRTRTRSRPRTRPRRAWSP